MRWVILGRCDWSTENSFALIGWAQPDSIRKEFAFWAREKSGKWSRPQQRSPSRKLRKNRQRDNRLTFFCVFSHKNIPVRIIENFGLQKCQLCLVGRIYCFEFIVRLLVERVRENIYSAMSLMLNFQRAKNLSTYRVVRGFPYRFEDFVKNQWK